MSLEKSPLFFPFSTKYFKGSVFRSNDQRMFEIGYYAYFAHKTKMVKKTHKSVDSC